ncbi:transcription initiation factor TFIID subunit 4-like [Cyprinodon tularosa]|uniref:transcription initiation factor TFIID subunit 4-like n=1 Tax=Cyprinodon tularosa TaxID=77115 RepID=UPI0018E1ED48|nr:transcription initiation factor TFIID subunit 4-like [Cyprinodon tularosa]XP_038137756.1 transcription initiation factor TFIID subunit 4-like [Cyprinodon tularosa]XP_038137757.1 transcription initiation factor TFIID subunit 4-like [Cyprinodon tularosa]
MDGTAGITPAAEHSTTAAQSHTAASDATADKQPAAAAPALDESGAVMNCHIPGSGQSDRSPTAAVNGPSSASPGFIIRTSVDAQNSAISSGDSSQCSVKTVPTVALVRPPIQTSNTVLSSGSLSDSCKAEPSKTITPTGAQVPASSVLTTTTSTMRSPTVLQNMRTTFSPTIGGSLPGVTRTIAPQVLAPRATQPNQNTTGVQNFQLPPGMVLVRSESGQLLMIHQQTLAQMQAQAQSQSAITPRPVAPSTTPSVQVTASQTPGAPLLARSVTPTTIIKQGSPVQTTVTTTATLQRPPVLQNTIVLGGNASSSGQALGTSATVQATTVVTQRVAPLGATGAPLAPIAISAETLENVKKCRNFLSTLIKLASNGKQSSETTASVKELVKSLLEGRIEPDDFTKQLYKELNSSPQPYLVPFLKRSLPALRQMTPDSEAFIQQSLLPQPSTQPTAAASTALGAVVLRPPLPPTATAATGTAATKATVITLSHKANSKPGVVVPQQPGGTVRPQVTLAQSPLVTIRGAAPSRIIVGQPQIVRQISRVSMVKQTVVPGARGVKVINPASPINVQNKLKEAGGGTFKDDDDINDVASMAGVNLSEESARIMATSSELVGIVTRSCKDEAFLSISSLTRIVLQIGKRFGVSELGTDVISYISHATQQRLQNLLEKASHVAQQKNINFREDERCEQVSDVRAQLKFFEQLDQMEKQRKEEQEREILLKAAKSRSRQEDPEQLRLKQKAKEMQQLELAQIRQREANLTALAAIGPRKKRKTDSPLSGASAEASGSGPTQPGGSNGPGSRQFMRQRITRVNLRDLLLCLENDRETSHSQLLYKGLLK